MTHGKMHGPACFPSTNDWKEMSGPVGISVLGEVVPPSFEPEFEAIAGPASMGLAHRRPQ